MTRYHSGLTHAEIGQILGMSAQNVQLIEARAVRKLRRAAGSSYVGPYKIRDTAAPVEKGGKKR